MMNYYVGFADGTGIEIEARDAYHAEELASNLYPDKEIIVGMTVCCEHLDLPF